MKQKKYSIFGLFLLIGITVFGQSIVPAGFSYQAIARDTIGSPKANQTVNIEFSITDQYETSTPWIETHSATTDQFGLFTVVIGQGTKIGGSATTFSNIDWKAYNYYVKIRIQISSTWFLIGKEPLLSVPYALVAKEAIYSSPIGTVVAFCGTTPPSGWLLCDGSEINRTTYVDLFNVIGVSFGRGNDATTYNLPDFRGRFLRGVDGTAGNDPDASARTAINTGGNTGNNVGSLQSDVLNTHNHNQNAHYHGITDPTHSHVEYIGSGSSGSGSYQWSNASPVSWTNAGPAANVGTSAAPTNISIDNATAINNATGGNETRPKNVYVNYIIKY